MNQNSCLLILAGLSFTMNPAKHEALLVPLRRHISAINHGNFPIISSMKNELC